MMRAQLSLLLLALVALGCDRGEPPKTFEDKPTVAGDENLTRSTPVIVEGCLTASGDRFVLSELDRGKPGPRVAAQQGERPAAEEEPTTESYRLVGMDDTLRPLVGQRVEITGASEPEKVVDVRESAPATAPAGERAAGTSGSDPQVSTVQTTRLEISDLRVRSVQATGARCDTRDDR